MEAEPPTRVRVFTQPEEADTHRGQVGTQGGRGEGGYPA
jgi:hypothetical protein